MVVTVMSVHLVILFNGVMLIISLIFYTVKPSRLLNYIYLLLSSIFVSFYLIQRDFYYGDTYNYIKYYMSEYSYLNFEYLFDLISRMFISVYPSEPIYFLFFCALITSVLFCLSYKNLVGIKYSYLAYWVLLSTFSFHYLTFEAIRTGISTGLVILGLSYLIKSNSWIKYCTCILFAIGFHYSAVPFIMVYFLSFIRKEIYYYVILILIGLFGKFLFLKIGSDIGLSIVTQKLEYYLTTTNDSNTILIRNIMMIIMLPVIYRVNKNRIYFNFYFLYALILLMTYGIEEINRRYLFMGPVFLIVILFDYLKHREYKRNWVFGVVLYMILYFYLFLVNYFSMYSLLNYDPIFKLF